MSNMIKQNHITRIKKEIRFVGLRRSGNHAIINWILKQSEQPVLFYNNVYPNNPFCKYPEKGSLNYSEYALRLYSLEDRVLPTIASNKVYPQKTVFNDSVIDERIDVLILRDPFNLFASRLKTSSKYNRNKPLYYSGGLEIQHLYLTYLKEYLGITNFLNNKKVCINYNKWKDSEEYRKLIASQLKINFTDKGLQEVSSIGGGSSFDQLNYKTQGAFMLTDQRWKDFSNSKSFNSLFKNQELLILSKEVFELEKELKYFVEEKIEPKSNKITTFIDKIKCNFLPFLAKELRDLLKS